MEPETRRLSDQGAGGGGLVAPGGGQDTDGLVVTGQTVDTGLDENQAELGVTVLAVALEAVSYTHLTLPTKLILCRSRWSPYH